MEVSLTGNRVWKREYKNMGSWVGVFPFICRNNLNEQRLEMKRCEDSWLAYPLHECGVIEIAMGVLSKD